MLTITESILFIAGAVFFVLNISTRELWMFFVGLLLITGTAAVWVWQFILNRKRKKGQ